MEYHRSIVSYFDYKSKSHVIWSAICKKECSLYSQKTITEDRLNRREHFVQLCCKQL